VGYPSGRFLDTVKYSPELNIWISVREHDNKYWNGFGIGEPKEGQNKSLKGEINFAYDGKNKRISGVFAHDDSGRVLALHRGKIGGGKKGVGKKLFTENFRGDFLTAIEEDSETKFCLVGDLNSTYFPIQVATFIKEIQRVKNLSYKATTNEFSELENFNYTAEHFGRIETEKSGKMEIERTHGIVVNELAQELQRRNYLIGNDKNRDLYTHNTKQIDRLFEIKTSCATQNLYAAVGQLIVYSIPIKKPVALFIVIPDQLNSRVLTRLLGIGIKPIYYKWMNSIPIFENLDENLNL